MFKSVVMVVLGVLPWVNPQGAGEVFPKGVWAFPTSVIVVHADEVGLLLEGDTLPATKESRIKLKVTKDTQLEQLDIQVADGKPAWTIKRLKLADLHQDQPLSVIFYSDGKDMTLLRGVASGPKLSGKDLAILVDKLGGKVKRQPFPKDREFYQVDLKGTKVTDVDLFLLAGMKGLYDLDLSSTGVTDKGITNLAAARELSSLDLVGTKVTDAAIKDLRRIPNLHGINLAQTAVTDRGVASLVKGKTLMVCRVGLGKNAQFRVHQEYVGGELSYNYLMIGDTYFGQYLGEKALLWPDKIAKDRRREATTYYHRHGPVGQVMDKFEWFKPADVLDFPSDARLPASLVGLLVPGGSLQMRPLVGLWSEPAIGVIRLQVGTQASYGRLLQHIDFYNSTPEVKAFSLPPKGQPVYFGYLQDAMKRGCQIMVYDGDERSTLVKKGPKKFYSALFVEITRNDLRDVNTNLLTKEALADFMGSLTEHGVVCFHTSHRYHDMTLPLIDAAQSLKLAWKVGKDMGNTSPGTRTHFSSEWVVIARTAEDLQHLTNVLTDDRQLTWTVPASTGMHLWRDGQPHDLKPLAHPPLR